MAFSQSALFLYLSFQFLILRLSTSVSTQFDHTFQAAILTSFILSHYVLFILLSAPRPQLGFLPVSFLTVTGCRIVAQPPNLDGQSTVFINRGVGWSSYTPRQRVPILVAFYGLHGLQ